MTSRFYSCSICQKVIDTASHISIADHNKTCNQDVRNKELSDKIQENNNAIQNLMEGISRRKRSKISPHDEQPDVMDSVQHGKLGAYTSQLLCKIPASALPQLGKGSLSPEERSKYKKRNTFESSSVEDSNFSSDPKFTNYDGIDGRDEGVFADEDVESEEELDHDYEGTSGDGPDGLLEENLPSCILCPITKNVLLEITTKSGYDDSFPVMFTPLEKALLELASIVTSVNAPHYIYSDLVKWGKSFENGERHERILSTKAISLEKLIKDTSRKFGIGNIFPQTNRLLLPSNNCVSVTTFDFAAQLHSLLTDDMLMQPENLIFGEDIFWRAPDHLSSHVYDDVGSSVWYYQTQQKVCISPTDVLCPLILYIDKTYVRGKGVEPISFTLAWFKRNIRNTPMSWRNIGMIPGKMGDLVPNMDFPVNELGEMHLNDWHYVVSHILTNMKQLQNLNGLEWLYRNAQGELQSCKLHIPIMFIIGDIEGHDKICSRKSGHNKSMKGVTHSCNVQRSECGDVNAVCDDFQKFDIKLKQDCVQSTRSHINDKMESEQNLKELGFYGKVVNAFFELDYGASPFGAHGACAICLLHTFKQKFPNVVVENFFRTFGKSTNTKGCHIVNKSVPKLVEQCIRQSDRTFPALNSFTVSLLKAKFQLNANEKYARLLALNLFCMTTYGWNFSTAGRFCHHKGPIVAQRIKLLEESMTIYKFLAQEKFPKECCPYGQESIKRYLSLFKEVVEWREKKSSTTKSEQMTDVQNDESGKELLSLEGDESTDGTNQGVINDTTFPKFHYLTHLIKMIQHFGSALNFDGGSCESNHKYLTKSPGMRTQGRIDTFDNQTAFNLSAKIVLDRACRTLTLKASYGVSMNFNSETTDVLDLQDDTPGSFGISVNKRSSHFSIDPKNNSFEIKWKTGNVKPKSKFPDLTLDAIRDYILVPGWIDSTVLGFTCLDWNNHIVRAHPSYRSGKSWYDYVNMHWREDDCEYVCPGKVCMFLDIRNHPKFIDGKYVIIHSTAVYGKYFRPSTKAKKVWKTRGSSPIFTFWDKEEQCQIAHVESIRSVAFVYPDFSDEDMTVKTGLVIEVKPIEDWIKLHNYSD